MEKEYFIGNEEGLLEAIDKAKANGYEEQFRNFIKFQNDLTIDCLDNLNNILDLNTKHLTDRQTKAVLGDIVQSVICSIALTYSTREKTLNSINIAFDTKKKRDKNEKSN